jgi:AraC-like DNA-binding protein
MTPNPVSLPLRRHPLIRTTSVEEASHLYSTTTTPIQVERAPREAPFEWQANRAVVGPMAISTSWIRSEFHARSGVGLDLFALAVARAGHCEHVVGNRTFALGPGHTGVIHSPAASPTVRLKAGFQGLQVAIQRRAIEAALAALTGVQPKAPLRFEPAIGLSSGVGASALSLVGFLMEDLDRESGALSSPLVAERLAEAFLYGLLTGQPHNHSHLLHARTLDPGRPYIRQIEEYLEANADKPVSLSDLAALTGVSVRSIQAGFRAHRGYTPMEYLRERRFELARRLLLSAAGKTVSEIALASGFEHLGRFSVEYRARFGESPRDTQRRGRAGGSARNG